MRAPRQIYASSLSRRERAWGRSRRRSPLGPLAGKLAGVAGLAAAIVFALGHVAG
jgi:hypothetical protein